MATHPQGFGNLEGLTWRTHPRIHFVEAGLSFLPLPRETGSQHSCVPRRHSPQTSKQTVGNTGAMKWRTHSCVPQRHSCRCLGIAKMLSAGRSADTAGRSACATRIHGHPIGQGRRFVAPDTLPPGIVPRSWRRLWIPGSPRQRHERAASPGGNVSGATRLCRKPRRVGPLKIGRRMKSCPTTDVGPRCFQWLAGRFVECVAAACRSACATSDPRYFATHHTSPRALVTHE